MRCLKCDKIITDVEPGMIQVLSHKIFKRTDGRLGASTSSRIFICIDCAANLNQAICKTCNQEIKVKE